jgi:nucleoside-diphosphate-sugar epimerase
MKILITGGNGYIAKSISLYLKDKYELISLNRDNSNLLDKDSIIKQLSDIKPDIIIHTAIEGGHRNIQYDASIVYKNLLMFENLLLYKDKVKFIFNIGSGAEFDMSQHIFNAKEEDIFSCIPKDYYGFSKNLISKRIQQINNNIINFRIFGIFDENENDTRFIKNNITRFKNGLPPEIHGNKYMDFFYIKDFISILEYYIINGNHLPKDINLCYEKKYKLTDIIKIIYGNGIEIQKLPYLFNYTGSAEKIKKINLKFIETKAAIQSILSQ